MGKFIRSNLWLAFFLQQGLLFLFAYLFLTAVRRLTGKTLHGSFDPVGLIDGITLVALSTAVIVLTRVYYHWLKGKATKPLGIALTVRRSAEWLGGFVLSFAAFILPWLVALARGNASIYDRIGVHFDNASATRLILVAVCLLIVQSMMEETANRAFPLRLWEDRQLAFRIIVPSVFFATIHFVDEPFNIARLGILLMAGITQSFAYLLTGDIWFTSGLHTGANFAAFSVSGRWHAGGVVALVGQPAIPHWAVVMLLLVGLSTAYFLFKRSIPNTR